MGKVNVIAADGVADLVNTLKFNPQGAYNPAAQYAVGDVVTHLGGSYRAMTAPPVGTPPTNAGYWFQLAQKGDTGPTGPAGAQGPQGPQGPTGPAGTAPADVYSPTNKPRLSALAGTDHNTNWGFESEYGSFNGQGVKFRTNSTQTVTGFKWKTHVMVTAATFNLKLWRSNSAAYVKDTLVADVNISVTGTNATATLDFPLSLSVSNGQYYWAEVTQTAGTQGFALRGTNSLPQALGTIGTVDSWSGLSTGANFETDVSPLFSLTVGGAAKGTAGALDLGDLPQSATLLTLSNGQGYVYTGVTPPEWRFRTGGVEYKIAFVTA